MLSYLPATEGEELGKGRHEGGGTTRWQEHSPQPRAALYSILGRFTGKGGSFLYRGHIDFVCL